MEQVIKELEKLQTALEAAEARLKNTSSERMVASEEMEALRQVQVNESFYLSVNQTLSERLINYLSNLSISLLIVSLNT